MNPFRGSFPDRLGEFEGVKPPQHPGGLGGGAPQQKIKSKVMGGAIRP